MNETASNVGGWPSSELYDYINTDIYNALPSDLRTVIINTPVISSHGSGDSNTLRADGNWASTDKLYLLLLLEVYGTNPGSDTASTEVITRQLDYYANNGVSTSNKTAAIKKNISGSVSSWWLRSACGYHKTTFYGVYTDGGWPFYDSYSSNGISAAFRLG